MMIPESYLSMAVGGLLFTMLSAIGAKALNEVSWHELKDYCKKHKNRARFDHIHDRHEEVTFGMETVRVVGSVLLIMGVAGWQAGSASLTAAQLLIGIVALLTTLLLATVWLPGALAAVFGEGVLFHMWRMFHLGTVLLWPLTAGVNWLENLFRRASGRREEDEEEAFEDEVLAIVTEGLHDGHLEADAREMIEGVIALTDSDVADIMTPLAKIDAFHVDVPWKAVFRMVTECGRTRIPVYEGSIDNVIGILYVKDLMRELAREGDDDRRSIRQLLRATDSVPRTMPLDELLQGFLQSRNHLALVRDEYMNFAGIVTIEDVLEEIVGEIVDESDKEQVGEIDRIDDRTVVIQGRAHLTEINEELGFSLPEPDDFDTMAGFVISQMGRIPSVGESLRWESLQITVVAATKRKVERVQIRSLEPIG